MSDMLHMLIVEARFYAHLADMLCAGAEAALKNAGASWERAEVSGALEIPSAIAFASDTGRYHGFVALGCVIRGETAHYDIVAEQSARGLMDLSLRKGLAIGNGILTVENEAQALARAGAGNKGAFAAEAALGLIGLRRRWHDITERQ